MSAAIGPFTQQSIKSYACQRPLHNVSASIPIASYLNSSEVVGIRPNSEYRMRPDLKIMAASLEGILGPASNRQAVPFECLTGNCDFDPYSSLAYCSSCADITSSVQEHWGPDYYDPDTTVWTYGLPGDYIHQDGASLPAQHCQLSFKDIKGHPHLSVEPTEDSDPDHLITCFGRNSHQSAFNLTILSMSWANCSRGLDVDNSGCDSYPQQLPSLANTSGLVAMNCTLGLCIADYTSRVRNGALEETMTGSLPSNLMSDDTSMFNILRSPCMIDSKEYDLSNISKVSSFPGRNLTTINVDGRNVTAPLECIFTTAEAVPWAINSFVQGTLFRPLSQKEWPTCKIDFNEGETFCDPWYLEPLFRGSRPTAATISSDIDSLAAAITNRLRVIGLNVYRNESGAILGTAIETTVCVRVDWPWLAFPAALVILTLALFITVVFKTRHSQIANGQPIWKSSAIVPFFHGLESRSHTSGNVEGDHAHHVGSTNEGRPESVVVLRGKNNRAFMTLKSMHTKAKKTVVKLDTAAKG